MTPEEKLDALKNFLKNLHSDYVIVGYSGGVDSTFLAFVAYKTLGFDRVIAITVKHPFITEEEVNDASNIARALGLKHVIVRLEDFDNKKIWNNPPDRCYLCKKNIFRHIMNFVVQNKLGIHNYVILDATNASDVDKTLKIPNYRPGIKALKELNIKSPLAEVGLTKEEIRILSKELGLPTWNKPSSPCLATRIPYNMNITLEKLERIKKAEDLVKDITKAEVLRVRDHELIARIEVGRNERKKIFDENIMDKLHTELRKLGYRFVVLDLYGYQEGAFDQ
ncbi:MAG: ATP-dependent sacrificial sulfur transferase LarE [Desulfurococcaceae archaeon]